ncbi:MAG: hypothetical protein F4X02_11980 [Chloroflexi bacterium]|nr:hypothetical protein [Chloroflexota bacterium]
MPFKIKRRGKLTYYYEADDPVLSNLVVETLPDGDLRICFSGLTGGYSAAGILGLDEVPHMDPAVEIPLVFQCWELWLQEAGICDSIADVDFIEVHAFATQPKSPSPHLDPAGYQAELERLRGAYARAYRDYFKTNCPDKGVPARFTVHVVDVPDQAASYEFYAVALHQRGLQV